MATRIEVLESFRITVRGEVITYRVLEGEVEPGQLVVSETCGDEWSVSVPTEFAVPYVPDGVERAPSLLLRPLTQSRKLSAGEIFRSADAPAG